MFESVQGVVLQIVACRIVGQFHAHIIGHNISVHTGNVHTGFQIIMIDGKACDLFHCSNLQGRDSAQHRAVFGFFHYSKIGAILSRNLCESNAKNRAAWAVRFCRVA